MDQRRQEAARIPDFGPRGSIYCSMVIVGSRRWKRGPAWRQGPLLVSPGSGATRSAGSHLHLRPSQVSRRSEQES